MYVLPFKLLTRALGDQALGPDGGTVQVPAAFLYALLRAIISQSDFDEEEYLQDNPDVAAAIRRGDHCCGKDHFAKDGYFEHRTGGGPRFSEKWYLRQNADVAEAVSAGIWTSGLQHYTAEGILEWRSPNADVAPQLEMWRQALQRA